jgi:hypothetical protein
MKIQSIKNLLILILFLQSILFVNKINAQTTSNGIFFQAVARDNFSNPARDRKIYIQSTIIQSTENGIKVLIEEHQSQADPTGVFSISIGQGTRKGGSAANLASIEWAKGPYFLNLKIAIQPIAPITNWDYTKELIDLGTTPFGTVPYAMYSVNSAKVDDKLNISDTTTMLKVYAKAVSVQTIEKSLASKLTAADTLTMLAPYAKSAYTIDSNFFKTQLATKLNLSDTIKYTKKTYADSAINKKINIADSLNYVTPFQLASKIFDTSSLSNRINLKANTADMTLGLLLKLNAADTIKYIKQTYTDSALLTKLKVSDTTTMLSSRIARDTLSLSNRINLKTSTTDVTTGLALKENISNKSTAVDLGGTSPSDILFPTQKAVKNYVLANNASGGVADGGITTIKIADVAVTDAKINTVSGSKVIGNITGNAATATLATNATTAGNITATSNTTLTSLSNLATVGTLIAGAVPYSLLTGTAPTFNQNTTGNAATATTATTAGTATTTTGNAGTATKLATARNINGALFDGSADILIPAKFTNDVTIKLSGSKSLGKYANGATIPTAGKTLDQFLLDLVQETVSPTYTAPTVSISSDKSASYEIGTNIGTVTLSKSFTQNNGGSLLSTTYYKDNVSLVSASTNSPGVLSTSISYSVTVTYGQGPVLNNNLGTPDATGQIPAGSKSSSLTISPFAYKYWGSSTLNSIDDATLRAGTNENSGKAKSSFTVPISGTKYIFYAYPASLGVLSSISVGGFDSFETFTLTTRDVTNASGYTQSYNIYVSNNKFSTDVNSIIIN